MSTVSRSQIVGLIATRLKLPETPIFRSFLSKNSGMAGFLERPELCVEFAGFMEALENRGFVGRIRTDLEAWEAEGIRVVAIDEPLYPKALLKIHHPPLILFFRMSGDLPSNGFAFEEKLCLAIVGSRRSDRFGVEIADAFAGEMAAGGACIVSGLALGIDTTAHHAALREGGECPTVAVLGNGLRTVYPAANYALAREIEERGGILFSQFEPDEKPYPVNFLNRNRIIAGLSSGVLVIQAGERSGSLVTARYALEEGREVMVVPGPINDAKYKGSNRLIRQGAALVSGMEDIREVFPQLEDAAHSAAKPEPLSKGKEQIVGALSKHVTISFSELLRICGKSPTFASDLLELEMDRFLVRLPGDFLALGIKNRLVSL